MAWTYSQSMGDLRHDGHLVGNGYAGRGEGLNNPAMQDARDVGPLPRGQYRIGPPVNPPNHLGPVALPLDPDPANRMFNRADFFMHGDNAAQHHAASCGCIIMRPSVRQQVDASGDRALTVIA